MKTARLIPLLTAPGDLQMAIDAWLWEQHNPETDFLSLRFYQWEPMALSLGYHQRDYPAQWRSLRWQNQTVDLVHRPTGGRAVLHQGDLCYALVLSPPAGASREVTYRRLCQFLMEGWEHLGFPLSFGAAHHSNRRIAHCFALATPADLCLSNGYKWIGNAQRWRSSPNVVLQQGSMRLTPPSELSTQLFPSPLADPPQTPLPSLETIASVLVKAAESCFQVKLISQSLTPAEWDRITQDRVRST